MNIYSHLKVIGIDLHVRLSLQEPNPEPELGWYIDFLVSRNYSMSISGSQV